MYFIPVYTSSDIYSSRKKNKNHQKTVYIPFHMVITGFQTINESGICPWFCFASFLK